jgi:hypothetical protein
MPITPEYAIGDWIYTGIAHDSSDKIQPNPRPGYGYVYVIGKSADGPVKLGIAANARKRIKEIETMNGEKFGFIWVSPLASNYAEIESSAHERMRKFRGHGEWFNLPFQIGVRVAMDYDYRKFSFLRERRKLAIVANSVRPI